MGILEPRGLATPEAEDWAQTRGLPELKAISLKSNQGPAKRKRHCRKRPTRPPRGTDTARALGSPRLPPRAWRTGSPSQAMAGPRLKRHSTPPGRRAPRVCMLLQWTWGGREEGHRVKARRAQVSAQEQPPWSQKSRTRLPAWPGRPSAGQTQTPSPRSHPGSCGCSTPENSVPGLGPGERGLQDPLSPVGKLSL